jgi:hypothetical protein
MGNSRAWWKAQQKSDPTRGRFLKEAKREGTVLRRYLDTAPRGGGSHVKLKLLERNFHVDFGLFITHLDADNGAAKQKIFIFFRQAQTSFYE